MMVRESNHMFIGMYSDTILRHILRLFETVGKRASGKTLSGFIGKFVVLFVGVYCIRPYNVRCPGRDHILFPPSTIMIS